MRFELRGKCLAQKALNENADIFIGDRMPLGAAGNVVNTYLSIIREKGDDISVSGDLDNEGGADLKTYCP